MPFELSPIALSSFERRLKQHHNLYERQCKAEDLEENLYRSLETDDVYRGRLIWKKGSHDAGPDIVIDNKGNPIIEIKGIGVKSGTIKNRMLSISGHRLTRFDGNFDSIHSFLKNNTVDVIVCCPYDKDDKKYHKYQLIYIDPSIFIYPTAPTSWTSRIGPRTGKIEDYTYIASNGCKSKIAVSMSWQIWWEIPLSLCRIGKTIVVQKIT